jgi:hypothetical protein
MIMTIVVFGRLWVDRINGNTYHTAEIIVDGLPIVYLGPRDGSGNMYLYYAFDWLSENGHIKGYEKHAAPHHWCMDNKILLVYSAANVKRKSDL